MELKKMICEMCGSNDLIKKDGFYVCCYCGTKYSTQRTFEEQREIEEQKIPRKIIIKRNQSWVGVACKMICYINDVEICRLSENECFETELNKAKYTFKCRLTLGNPMSDIYTIDLNNNYVANVTATQKTWKPQVSITYQNR